MRKIYSLLFATALFTVGCDSEDLEEFVTITTDVEVTETFEVRIEDGQPLLYSASETFDANSEDDFSQFGDKIDQVTVTGVSYKIIDNSNFDNSGEAQIVSGVFSFEKTSDNSEIDVASVSTIDIASTVGVETPMNFDQNALNEMAAEFKTTNKISTNAAVEVDAPVSFDLEVTITMEVSGSVLD